LTVLHPQLSPIGTNRYKSKLKVFEKLHRDAKKNIL
jgi:hypothetical protein